MENPTAYITPEAIYEIARIKQTDDHMWHLSLEGIARSVIGTAKTLGVQVREAEDDDKNDTASSSDE